MDVQWRVGPAFLELAVGSHRGGGAGSRFGRAAFPAAGPPAGATDQVGDRPGRPDVAGNPALRCQRQHAGGFGGEWLQENRGAHTVRRVLCVGSGEIGSTRRNLMKLLFAVFVSTLALSAQDPQSNPPVKKPAAPKAPAKTAPKAPKVTDASRPMSIPAQAVLAADGDYHYTDPEGKKWIYRKTPFGVARMEDTPQLTSAKADRK